MSDSASARELDRGGIIAVPDTVGSIPALTRIRSAARAPSLLHPLVLTGLLVVGGLWPASALRIASDAAPIDATLRLPWMHVATAPVSGVLDAMSLLSSRQHIALLISIVVLYAMSRMVARKSRFTLLGEAWRALAAVLAVVGFYAFGVLAPRPMAALELDDPALVVVDFHSHTEASHDGRPGHTAERNRAWHRDAGFDAAYVSDHGTRKAVVAAMSLNPARSGEGMTLLPAMEIRCNGAHLVLLGLGDGRDRKNCSESPLVVATRSGEPGPVALFTMPGNPERIPDLPIVGAELIDAAPRAFDEPASDWALLRQHAMELDLALVASTNNHGWGRLSAGWSVMRIDGWRMMSPDQLDEAIRHTLLEQRGSAVTVIERLRPPLGTASMASLSTTAPTLAWHVIGTLSGPERISWALWIWTAWVLIWMTKRSRGRSRPLVAD